MNRDNSLLCKNYFGSWRVLSYEVMKDISEDSLGSQSIRRKSDVKDNSWMMFGVIFYDFIFSACKAIPNCSCSYHVYIL